MTWIKFCGNTSLQDAQFAVAAGADALGFIFTPSARRVELADAAAIVAALPSKVEKIGIVVNETPARAAEIADQVGLTGIQLQGDEPAERLPEFRRALGRRKIVKTLQARELLASGYGAALLEEYLQQVESLDAVLLDSGSPGERGGTGKTFNWETAAPMVARIKAELPVIIAGGLNPGNVAEAIRWFEPWGVDVASGVETAPGKKDRAKLKAFAAEVRAANTIAKTV